MIDILEMLPDGLDRIACTIEEISEVLGERIGWTYGPMLVVQRHKHPSHKKALQRSPFETAREKLSFAIGSV